MAVEPRTQPNPPSAASPTRVHAAVAGAVQGVGFRPFVYRLACELGLCGWVRNAPQGVILEVEGPEDAAQRFLERLEAEPPAHAVIRTVRTQRLAPAGYDRFDIRPSVGDGAKTALVLPDLATCPDCIREIFDPENRRFRYPFTNCTHCGPRYSIIENLPYDRPNTTMRGFEMCAECRAEYEDPEDRRFHAQPNACSACGPRLELWNAKGRPIAADEAAIEGAVRAILRGRIVAVKGVGGFHLMADACDRAAVRRLRRRKKREEKPLALMIPSLAVARSECEVSPLEESLLAAPEAPIVLLRRYDPNGTVIASEVAPGNPYLGMMLPYTPLHHILMAELGFPVVATSGNLTDEPICTDEREAAQRLAGVADYYLTHNRPIVRHVDDSVARVALGRPMLLRRARGYAPLPIYVENLRAAAVCDGDGAEPGRHILAVGAHLKNAIAASIGQEAFLSQHIGDLETAEAHEAFARVTADFQRLYALTPSVVACDAHPDYLSTQFAANGPAPAAPAQHHYAHVLSCMAENGAGAPALGIAFDGAGYGDDGVIWGGEFLRVGEAGYVRAAHLRPFRLPGGDTAAREPRRAALGILYEIFGPEALNLESLAPIRALREDRATLLTMLERGLNVPWTTSAGRLFDAVSALVSLRQESRFEGQAAMDLEFALTNCAVEERYAFGLREPDAPDAPIIVDWEPVIRTLLNDLAAGTGAGCIAARFHEGLVDAIVAVARRIGEPRVALSGGCFQNMYLLERAVRRLEGEGFEPLWHRLAPPNDGGIALGQIVAAARQIPG